MSTNGTYADRIRVEVSNQFMHPQYDDDTLKNDIGWYNFGRMCFHSFFLRCQKLCRIDELIEFLK